MTLRLMMTVGKSAVPPLALPAPWNADTTITLKTYDGTGDTIHPSVIDMGEQGWNGYRYWLADTPYAGGDNQLENPCIWAGDSPTDFVVPPGVVNPLSPAPGVGVGFHSDTEIVHDPATGRMVIYYRRYFFAPRSEVFVYALSSADGITWADEGPILQLPFTPTQDQYSTPEDEYVSPTVVRIGAGEWRMWVWGGWRDTAVRYEATSPLGPWTKPTSLTLNGHGLLGWHGDVIRIGTRLYMVYSDNNHWTFRAATSTDGINWVSPTNATVMEKRDAEWDYRLYRPTIAPDPDDPRVMRMWYSAISPSSPGGHAIGYTRLPISAWTD